MDKKELRTKIKKDIAALSEGRKKMRSYLMAGEVLSDPVYVTANTVFIYVSKDDEPDTIEIIKDALGTGKSVLVPRIKENGEMDAVKINSLDELSEGKFGIPEPPKAAAADKSSIELAIVPALAADENGNRLGRGGGYYDRFLKGRTYEAWALTYISCSVPCEAHDEKVDRVLCNKL